jgi:hypothetical protein
MSVRDTDPPVRPPWVRTLPTRKRATALLREYLEGRARCEDKEESAACRSFLRAFAMANGGGVSLGYELNIVEAGYLTVGIYAYRPGVMGTAPEVPTLVTHHSSKLKHIVREISESRLAEHRPEPKPRDPDAPERRNIPPKVNTFLVTGR